MLGARIKVVEWLGARIKDCWMVGSRCKGCLRARIKNGWMVGRLVRIPGIDQIFHHKKSILCNVAVFNGVFLIS